MKNTDCAVVGASFAGLACATAVARAGMRVTVLERKADVGAKLHTTGIIVKDAIDQVPLLDGLPAALVRRINGVRLYAPNLRSVDLTAPGYYFLATDTPQVMRWLAARAEEAGARIAYQTLFGKAERTESGFDLGEVGTARFLVGADGPCSRVAQTFGLGQSRKFLFGIEHEYAGVEVREPDKLHCFIDRSGGRHSAGRTCATCSSQPVRGNRGDERVLREDCTDIRFSAHAAGFYACWDDSVRGRG